MLQMTKAYLIFYQNIKAILRVTARAAMATSPAKHQITRSLMMTTTIVMKQKKCRHLGV